MDDGHRPTNEDQRDPAARRHASGRDQATESEPTSSGHSTSDTQEQRNREDEPPG